MQEVFEKIKQKLEELPFGFMTFGGDMVIGLSDAIEIVDQVAEEYNKVSVEGDLISKSALLEDLRKYEDECESILMLPSWFGACSIIKKQQIIQNNGWIPCSERLPECEDGWETEALLFQLKGTDTIECGYYGVGGRYRDKYFRTYRDSKEGYDARDVIAWQPLPKPYKKEV